MIQAGSGSAFGARVRRARVALGITQEELAQRAGLSLNAVSSLERGDRRYPYPRTVQVLADALELSHDEREALSATIPRRFERVSRDVLPSALPIAATPIVGRLQETAAVIALLRQPAVRLLTLIGPGGVGKTRLALQVATEMHSQFGDDVRFVSLASISDSRLVLSAIIQALDIRGSRGTPEPDLINQFLRDSDVVLVLDNFEQVPDAALDVAGILAHCPRVRIIVTSRSPLRVDGEQEFPVRPFAVPEAAGFISVEDLSEDPAIALFLQRARAVRPSFAMNDRNALTIIAICAQLDGLPLAIELAAARVKLLSPQAILHNLSSRLSVLTGGGPDRHPRLQTMRAAISWSFGHLEEREQRLFRRLSVFAGGCLLESAEAVCVQAIQALEPQAISPDHTALLDSVAAVVDHSMLQRDESATGEVRIGMLQTIQEFGYEQLVEHGEVALLRQLHARHYLDFTQRAREALEGAGRKEAHTRIQHDLDNIRAALAWFHEQGDTNHALALATEMARFWVNFGYIDEGASWMERVLGLPGPGAPRIRFEALYWAAILATLQDALPRASDLAEEALALARSNDNPMGTGMALFQLADAVGVDDPDRAIVLVEESLDIFRHLGDPFREASAYRQLGLIVNRQGKFDRAVEYHTTALEIWRTLDHPWGVPISRRDLAVNALALGNLETARQEFRASLFRWRELGERLHLSDCISGLAGVAIASDEGDTAVLLLGAQEALDQAMGYVHARSAHHALIESARKQVPSDDFDELWARGRESLLDDVLERVMAMPLAPPNPPPKPVVEST